MQQPATINQTTTCNSGGSQVAQIAVAGGYRRVVVTPLPLVSQGTVTVPTQAGEPRRNCYSNPQMFSYRVKIMNPIRKKDSIVRDIRKFCGKFTSVIDLKVKLMEEFEDQVPPTTRFSVGYFVGRQSTKKWLVTQEDLTAMYSELSRSYKTDICLWCDGYSEESENHRKRKQDGSPGPTSKRAEKEREIDDLVTELKEMHKDKHNLSDPQYRLWARMKINGLHASKETPPQVPMITGATPTRARRSIEETVASTVTAVVKGMGAAQPLQPQQNASSLPSHLTSPQTLGVSPSKAVEIRGKCFAQLASLKQLFEESVLTEEELKEQKGSILETLRKLS